MINKYNTYKYDTFLIQKIYNFKKYDTFFNILLVCI